MGEDSISQISEVNFTDIAEDSIKPYYLHDEGDRQDIEMYLSTLSPVLRERHGLVEDIVSNQFIEKYGEYLNEQQQRYFKERQVIFTNHELADRFAEQWNINIETINPELAAINGVIFTAYSIGVPVEEQVGSKGLRGGSYVSHYWAGRFAVYPLYEDEVTEVDPKWLISEKEWDRLGNIKEETPEAYKARSDALYPYVMTNVVGGVAIHEKVHGIQDYELPLPVLEAAAHYYQMEIAKEYGWQVDIRSNMEQLAAIYGQLIDVVGEDVHRLIFGNLSNSSRKKFLLQKMKEYFSLEAIEKASRYNEYHWHEEPGRHIYWATVKEGEWNSNTDMDEDQTGIASYKVSI